MILAGVLAAIFAVAVPDSTPFDRFSFRYETGYGDLIDTRQSTIARDNCEKPPTRGHARLSRKQLRVVYDRLMALRAFELPTPQPALPDSGEMMITEPSTWVRVELRAGRSVRAFAPSRSRPVPLPDEWRRMDAMIGVLDSTLRALPEYRALPPPPCLRE